MMIAEVFRSLVHAGLCEKCRFSLFEIRQSACMSLNTGFVVIRSRLAERRTAVSLPTYMPSDGYASWTIIVAVAGFWISLNVASWVATKFRNNNNNNNNNNLIPGRRQVSRLTGHVGVAWLWLDWHCDDTATVRTSAGATPIKRPQSYNTALSQYLDFGIIACSLLLVLTPCWLLLRAGHLLLSTTSNAVSPLVDHGTSLPILIPGVTTPLRDVPAMLLAGFLAVVWHEAGHALAARA